MLILSRDYMQIRTAEQEYRGLVARQPILPEMTSWRKWPRPNFKKLSRDSEQADTADQVYRGLIRVRLIVSEKSACLCSSVKIRLQQKSPLKQREVDFEWPRPLTLILSRDYMQIRTAEQEYHGLVARQPILPEMTSWRKWPRPNFKKLSRDSEQADTADQVYRGLIRVRLIVSEKSACLCLQCENSITAKITPETEGGWFWVTTPTYVNFVTWLYANSYRWTRISRSRCQATNTTGNDVMTEVTTPEF